MASAFNMDKTTFLGNVIGVNDFDVYETIKQADGSIVRSKAYDGSAILGIMCDKRWFRIHSQEIRTHQHLIQVRRRLRLWALIQREHVPLTTVLSFLIRTQSARSERLGSTDATLKAM